MIFRLITNLQTGQSVNLKALFGLVKTLLQTALYIIYSGPLTLYMLYKGNICRFNECYFTYARAHVHMHAHTHRVIVTIFLGEPHSLSNDITHYFFSCNL